MRLLNTSTLEFREFFNEQRPRYAILSHRWTGDETSYKDFSKGRNQDSEGHRKVVSFCTFAKRKGYEWVWVDTCCIDKRSSAELSEAINSMFQWYHDADICYVYLQDLPPTGRREEAFQQSVWFSRGWTLQELLAPAQVVFCDAHWEVFGEKHSMADKVAAITGIKRRYLTGRGLIHTASVAAKMSWLSRRRTTRREDIAYCVLGIFGVNMPLLYGEGEKAFLRLQMEILRKTADTSLFAWDLPESSYRDDTDILHPMLATSPLGFVRSGDVIKGTGRELAYSITQRGITFSTTQVSSAGPELEWDDDGSGFNELEVVVYDSKMSVRRLQFQLDCRVEVGGQLHIPFVILNSSEEARMISGADWRRSNLLLRSLQEVRKRQTLSSNDTQLQTLTVWQPMP